MTIGLATQLEFHFHAPANYASFIHFHATSHGQVVALQLLRELLHSGVRMDTASCCTGIGALLRVLETAFRSTHLGSDESTFDGLMSEAWVQSSALFGLTFQGTDRLAMKKKPWLVIKGIILPSYIGITINHYNDPY